MIELTRALLQKSHSSALLNNCKLWKLFLFQKFPSRIFAIVKDKNEGQNFK